jgi:hypothetical protein
MVSCILEQKHFLALNKSKESHMGQESSKAPMFQRSDPEDPSDPKDPKASVNSFHLQESVGPVEVCLDEPQSSVCETETETETATATATATATVMEPETPTPNVFEVGHTGVVEAGYCCLLFKRTGCGEGLNYIKDLFPQYSFEQSPRPWQNGGNDNDWFAVTSKSEADLVQVRKHLLSPACNIVEILFFKPGKDPSCAGMWTCMLPKQDTWALLADCVTDTRLRGVASVLEGPCVGADVVHDIIFFDSEEAAAWALPHAAMASSKHMQELRGGSPNIVAECLRQFREKEAESLAISLHRSCVDPRAIRATVAFAKITQRFQCAETQICWPLRQIPLVKVTLVWQGPKSQEPVGYVC